MVSWLFLVVSLVGAAFTLSARYRLRIGPALVPWFFAGWLTSELALVHLAWQAVATILFVAFGALASWPGVLGLLVTFASWWALVGIQRRRVEAQRRRREDLARAAGPRS